MKPTALVLCPGRGTYQKAEFGCLRPFYHSETLALIDQKRRELNLPTVSELDGADKYLPALHQQPANNAALIYAAGLNQFAAISRDDYQIVAVSGNSMGWYTAMSCAGVWDAALGTAVVSRMAQLTAGAAGKQFIYPLLDADWRLDPEKQALVAEQLQQQAPDLYRSIQYGGYAVLAGTDHAVSKAMAALPPLDERFPLLLQGHAAFHSPLMQQASEMALAEFSPELWQQPKLPLIDGAGRIWPAGHNNLQQLQQYTFGTQVSSCYNFTQAVQLAVKEFSPDQIILLGPGQNLGGAVAQSLIEIGWRGLRSKQDFADVQQSATPFLIEAASLI
jgi:[acyl-carrier-protein] S-malonyltransferase